MNALFTFSFPKGRNYFQTLEIKKEAKKYGYKPLITDGIQKVVDGITTLDELNRKLRVF